MVPGENTPNGSENPRLITDLTEASCDVQSPLALLGELQTGRLLEPLPVNGSSSGPASIFS
ncbi:hypothetical protein MASR1M12_10580 [Erysipelotrichia bacterium]